MKTLTLLLVLTLPAIVLADDDDSTGKNLLKNGDFSSGINHWEGDCHTPDSSSFDPTATAPTNGVVVKLNHYDWTKVIQDFDGKIGEYTATVTYTVSTDLKFSSNPDDYKAVPSKLGFTRLSNFNSAPGDWILFINDLGAMHYTYWRITPKLDGSGQQTIKLRIRIDSGADAVKGFFLLFPPGHGYLNLLNVLMTPASPASQ